MAHEARYAFKVGNKVVTMTVEAAVEATKCCCCGCSTLEARAYSLLARERRINPKHPRLSAAAVARHLGVQYRKAVNVCLASDRIKLESWHVNTPRYTCRDFYVD